MPTSRAPVAQVGYEQANPSIVNPMRSQTGDRPVNAFRHAAPSQAVMQTQYTVPVLEQPATRPATSQNAPSRPGQSQLGQPRLAAPVGNYRPASQSPASQPNASGAGVAPRRDRMAQPNDFFNNPFADQTKVPAAAVSTAAPRVAVVPAPAQVEAGAADGIQLPGTDAESAQIPSKDQVPSNDLRLQQPGSVESPPAAEGLGFPGQADESASLSLPGQTAPAQETPGESLGDLLPPGTLAPEKVDPEKADDESMRNLLNDPNEQVQVPVPDPDVDTDPDVDGDQTKSPSDIDLPGAMSTNPFNEVRGDGDRQAPYGAEPGETSMLKANQLSCEDFRERIARETIDRISLDPSPPFRPDLFDPVKYQEKREQFEQRQTVRSWTRPDGTEIAKGRFVDLAYEQVIVETEDGAQTEVPVKRLGEGDLGYLSENWGLPKECLIEQVAYTPRAWTPLEMTWKASNLCSKPRYFEEVNLERYGHTAGPWLQPVVSSAHFFANIAVLPYKMGVHTPGECHYALGYYRPGNCAPWIVHPVPISARGALAQGAFMTGAFWLIP